VGEAKTGLSQPARAGDYFIATVANEGFRAGQKIVLSRGTAIEEFNTIKLARRLSDRRMQSWSSNGTFELMFPLRFNHPVNATIESVVIVDPTSSTTSSPLKSSKKDSDGSVAITIVVCVLGAVGVFSIVGGAAYHYGAFQSFIGSKHSGMNDIESNVVQEEVGGSEANSVTI